MSANAPPLTIADREVLWTRFLQRWPLEKLSSMTLREYNQAGDDDHFCRWVEKHTEALGSIWGGSSLKFGIYSRSSTAAKEPSAQRGVMQDASYGWYSKHGHTADEAFSAIKQLIVQTAQAARAGRLDEVESIDLWPIFRRKIAFLYQDREQPCILPIYMGPMLRQAWPGPGEPPQDAVALYEGFMARRAGKPVLGYADDILVHVAAAQARSAAADGDDVLRHFGAANGLMEALQAEGTVEAFVELARGLHQRGLDWWITKAEMVHAGRTEDPEIWGATVALRLSVANGAIAVQIGEVEDQAVRPLTADSVAAWMEQAAGDARIRPVTHRAPCWPDDYGRGEERLTVALTEAHIRGGRVKVSKLQRLFPATSFCAVGERPAEPFVLDLPDGQRVDEAWVLNDRHRIQPKMGALMAKQQLKPGDYAVITKLGTRHYQLSFAKQGQFGAAPQAAAPAVTATELRTSMPPLNQILFGPPGTGKTYSTIDAAMAVLAPDFLEQHRTDRTALKARFDALVQERRVRFVTFHQSFSYEDFVEGLRATTNEDTGQIRYEVVDGVFKSLCEAAAAKVTRPQETAAPAPPIDIRGRRIWKMSLGNTLGSDAAIYDECIEKGYALLGYGGGVDFTGCTSREDVLKRFTANGLKVENPQTDYAVTSVAAFVTRMKPGDLMIISDGNFKFRAIGEVSSEYQYRPRSEFADEYTQMRAVKWLRTYEPSLPHGELMNNQFSQMTLYELRPGSIDLDKLQRLLGSSPAPALGAGGLQLGAVGTSDYKVTQVTQELIELSKPNGNRLHFAQSMLKTLADGVRSRALTIEDIRDKQAIARLPGQGLEPYVVNGYANVLAPLVAQMLGQSNPTPGDGVASADNDARVLIIDEINRGNISRIFGELITLIEPSKRAGASEALEAVLPYSKKPFSVPGNVYLIGTMNTADRSLTGMDVALRRRFVFKAMPPRPDLLDGIDVEGIAIDRLLSVLNQRIEALLDRDHCLGHAYFMPLRQTPTLAKLAEIFGNQVLPLLQEYFFDDWQRIQWVLNDHRKPEAFQFVSARGVGVDDLFGSEVNVAHNPKAWTVNDEAFQCAESYLGVIDHRDAQEDDA